MPFRLGPNMTKLQFVTAANHPMLIHQAAQQAGLTSNTAWVQRCIARGLAEDLGLNYDDLVADLPRTREHYTGTWHGRSRVDESVK